MLYNIWNNIQVEYYTVKSSIICEINDQSLQHWNYNQK